MDEIWYCVSCGLEFGDPHDPDANEGVTVLSVRGRVALVMMDGLPHSLRKRTAELKARLDKTQSQGLEGRTVYLQERRKAKEKETDSR
jgi:hypothetical protein